MYSNLVRSASGLALKSNTRHYATRRVITQTPSTPLPVTRQFQSIGQLQAQPGLSEQIQTYDHVSETGNFHPDHLRLPSQNIPETINEPLASRDQGLGTKIKNEQVTSTNEGVDTTSQNLATPLYFRGSSFDRFPYWQKIGRWKHVTEKEFLTHSWQIAKNIQGSMKLYQFLNEVLPAEIPLSKGFEHIRTKEAFIEDVVLGIKTAPMSIRLTPHILSVIDWNNPIEDPLRRQFIPMKSMQLADHPKLTLDSLHEADDSPVQGLVHRYVDKVLLLVTSVCGQYCRYCTRSYAVGGNTETVTKKANKPIKTRWDDALAYIRSNPVISDVVVSGGDSYYLTPEQLRYIGDALLEIPHIRRFRIATKGLCFSPSRTLDTEDTWTDELVRLVNRGRERGVQVALHTHFNHSREMTWVTRESAQKLFKAGVVVRNQSVLLRGVNDDVKTMATLIRDLADMNIQPYYVYQCDMVAGIEDLRTPLSKILSLEREIRGSIAGFMMPSFVVDLPGGGGKRLAASFESYDKKTGRSTFVAPAVKGGKLEKEGRVYEYWDPVADTGAGGEVAGRGSAVDGRFGGEGEVGLHSAAAAGR